MADELVLMRAAAQETADAFAAINRTMLTNARKIAKAFGVPLHLLGLDPLLCDACRRRFKGPWQARKHRRTAHG